MLDRSKWNGCEYCKTDLDGYSTFFKDKRGKSTKLYIPDGKPEIANYGANYGCDDILIHYCPFCGRPLTESAWKEIEVKMSNG